ncbi:MAG TPA: hypothetical protein DDW65_06825 [Firmicutes bacterium]|jgi:hypothetical protein|nr:hypothetical protein [Bacillota bacterium]
MRYRKILIFISFLLILVIALVGCGGGKSGTALSTTDTVSGLLSISGETFSTISESLTTQSLVSTQSFSVVKLKTSWTEPEAVSGEKIVKFRSGMSTEEINQLVSKLGGTIKNKIYGSNNTYLIKVDSQAFSASSVSKSSDIVYAANNHKLHIMASTVAPDDPYYSAYQTWNYDTLLHLPEAWAVQKGSSSVIVAVVDSGVSSSHTDLKNNMVSNGYDFVNNDSDPSDTEYYKDNEYSHGTHVAGTISAE